MTLPTRWVISLALGLAMLSFVAAVFILLQPLGSAGEEYAQRGSLSSAVSTGFALVLSIIAVILTARVSSSDFRAEQETKTHTAELLASLRSIIAKGALGGPLGIAEGLDFSHERQRINEFLNSTTAFAFWSWEAEAGRRAGERPEEWRAFFLYLLEILGSPEPALVVNRAVAVERLLTGLSRRDILRIAGKNSNLASAIPDFERSRVESATIGPAATVYAPATDDPQASFRARLVFLKEERGIDDPDLDMFLAAMDGDEVGLRSALERGANAQLRDAALLARYREQLADFPGDG